MCCVRVYTCSVMSHSLWPHGTVPSEILCLWNFPGKNSGVDCHFLLQGFFPIQWSNPHCLFLQHWQADSLPLYHLGSKLSFWYACEMRCFLASVVCPQMILMCNQIWKPEILPPVISDLGWGCHYSRDGHVLHLHHILQQIFFQCIMCQILCWGLRSNSCWNVALLWIR